MRTKTIRLTPAYGRDYNSAVSAEGGWITNRDFKIGITGPYVNKAQTDELKKDGFTEVKIFYKKMSRTITIKL